MFVSAWSFKFRVLRLKDLRLLQTRIYHDIDYIKNVNMSWSANQGKFDLNN